MPSAAAKKRMSDQLPYPDDQSRLSVTDLDAQLRERLERLLQDHSQADLARKTGWTRSNVNRYVHGAKIPGEFLVTLCTALNVNPVWLLTGKGDLYVTDVSANTQTNAHELLRLIEALNAVDKMRLGQVASKLHLKVLHDLREAMRKYRDVRDALKDKLRPAFEQLLADLRQALERGKLERATNARESAAQLADFCDDPNLLLEFDQHQATLEYMLKRPKSATEYQRRSFVRSLLAGRDFTAESAVAAHNLVISLVAAGQLDEAENICQAARALIPLRAKRLESFQRLLILHADVMMELGNVNEGVKVIQSVLAEAASEGIRAFALDYSTKALALGGTLQYENIGSAAGASLSRAGLAVLYACWTENPAHVRDACARHIDTGVEGGLGSTFVALHAHALLGAASGDANALIRFRGDAESYIKFHSEEQELLSLYGSIVETQAARLLARTDEARSALLGAADHWEGLPKGTTPSFLLRAIHARNVLDLVTTNERKEELAAMRAQAEAFIAEPQEKSDARPAGRVQATTLPAPVWVQAS